METGGIKVPRHAGFLSMLILIAIILPLLATAEIAANASWTMADAIAQNPYAKPTKKIVKPPAPTSTDLNVTVYLGTSGRLFHKISCKNLKGGTPITRAQALAKGYFPCPLCKP